MEHLIAILALLTLVAMIIVSVRISKKQFQTEDKKSTILYLFYKELERYNDNFEKEHTVNTNIQNELESQFIS